MKKILHIVLFLLLTAAGAAAQTVQDSGYKVVAHIKPDGTVQDSGYKVIAHRKCLGEYAGIRKVYRDHLNDCFE